jgi:hypothetical protein
VLAEDVEGLVEAEFSAKGEDALTLHVRERGGSQEESGDVADIDKVVCKYWGQYRGRFSTTA